MSALYHLNQNSAEDNLVNIVLQVKADNCTELIQHLVNLKLDFKFYSSHNKQVTKEENKASYLPLDIPNSSMKKIMEAVYQKYIVNNIENIPPTQESIANELGISYGTFKTHFKEAFGKPFYQLYTEKKMEYAARLLMQGLKVVQVSDRVGYSHPIKFNKMFQKHFGITPKRFQMIKFKEARTKTL